MRTYVLLKNGLVKILWADYQKNEIIEVYDPEEPDSIEIYSYSDICVTDTNLSVLLGEYAGYRCGLDSDTRLPRDITDFRYHNYKRR